MEIKGTGFAYNVRTGQSSTSDWGAEIGQGNKKLMSVVGASEIINGMLYYKVDENNIKAILGKGNRTLKPITQYLPDTSIVLGSLVEKISVNGTILPDAKLIMFITKDEQKINGKGEPNLQYQRRYLKFSATATYNDIDYNKQCIDAITQQLGCQTSGSWIVTDMNFEEEVLALKAIVLNNNNSYHFTDSQDRKEKLKRFIYEANKSKFKPSAYKNSDLSPIILYGPPGTGKTHTMQNDYISKFDEDNRFVTTFHQSFTYEEFVEGLKPILNDEDDSEGDIKYKIEKGVLSLACERAAQMAGYASLADCISDSFDNRHEKFNKAIEEKKLVLLCIDEINRGNVASIFGDLISLIEQSKRLGAVKEEEMMVTLPYSKEKFGVPSNLLIVGTMNTADRSIQLLDSALRRRFKFKELLPNYSVFNTPDLTLKPIKDKAKTILERINDRIRCLLNKDNQIGHSYLMFAETDKDIFNAIITKIIPLLEEYFYDDIQKVRFVLNENEKTQHPFYVEDKEAKKAYEEYVTTEDIDSEGKSFFGLNDDITSIKDENVGNYLKHLLGENE